MEALNRIIVITFSILAGAAVGVGLLLWRFIEFRQLALRTFAGKREVVPPEATWDTLFGLDFGVCTESDLQRRYLELENLIRKVSYQPGLDLARLYYLQFQADSFLRTRDRIMPGISKAQKQQRKARQQILETSDWRKVLGVAPGDCDVKRIKRAYRTKAARHHPDRGGDDAVMGRLNHAYRQAKQELGFV
jgi:hypothetical protein